MLLVVVVAATLLLTRKGDNTDHPVAIESPTQVDTGPTSTFDDSDAPTLTTNAATSTTEPSEPGVPVLVDGTTDPNGSVDIVQQYASALADGHWAEARTVYPSVGGSGDAPVTGFEALEKSTVFATSVSPDGTDVRGAYLAWEALSDGPQTSIYCMHWTVDPQAGIVTDIDSSGLPSKSGAWTSFESPADAASEVQALCG